MEVAIMEGTHPSCGEQNFAVSESSLQDNSSYHCLFEEKSASSSGRSFVCAVNRGDHESLGAAG
jgi:hypothetical protein